MEAVDLALRPSVASAEEEKFFKTLAARFAIAGHMLVRSDRLDGPVSYYATRWGHVRELRDLQAAAEFLRQIEGGRR